MQGSRLYTLLIFTVIFLFLLFLLPSLSPLLTTWVRPLLPIPLPPSKTWRWTPFKVTSLNTKGLNTPEKRRILLTDLKKSRTDIAFIQETHFKTNKSPALQNRFFPHAYHSTNSSGKSRGVSILISNRLPWQFQEVMADPEGRYLFLIGRVGEAQFTLATLYAPNEQQDSFIKRTIQRLMEYKVGQLILGGDFNVPLAPSVDTSSGTSSLPHSHRKRIAQTLHNAHLIDIWRLQHSGERDYTFYSSPHKVYSRIDFFLLPHDQLHLVETTTLGQITWSDHAPIHLTYTLSERPSPRSIFWRLNESLLQTLEVLGEVSKAIDSYF